MNKYIWLNRINIIRIYNKYAKYPKISEFNNKFFNKKAKIYLGKNYSPKISENDNGSTPVQIALITSRIERLTEHSKLHKHDYSSKKGLVTLVDQRRKLLSYLRKNDNNKEK